MVYGRKGRPFDWISFSIYISLVVIGWLMVYASGIEQELSADFDGFFPPGLLAQGYWVLIALLVFGVSYLIDSKFWVTFAYPVFAFSLFLLLLVLVLGSTIKGSTSWFQLFGFSFQPSEIAKVGTGLALAAYLSHYKTDLSQFKYQVYALGIIAIPVFLIMLQPDAGSALVFSSLMIVLFREGMPAGIYIILLLAFGLFVTALLFSFQQVLVGMLGLAALVMLNSLSKPAYRWLFNALIILTVLSAWWLDFLVPAIWVLSAALVILLLKNWMDRNGRLVVGIVPAIALSAVFTLSAQYVFNDVLKPHQQDRINVWLQPEKCDPRGSLYNLLQSKVAIGSGGLQGKGFLQGTMTKLNYVPEQSTDFIFSTIGEEQGFIGSVGIIVLFVVLIMRIMMIGERSTMRMYRHFAYAVAGYFFIHCFINIGMTMGLVPIVGIPLPLISKGGSSLIGFSMMMGILLRMDRSGR